MELGALFSDYFGIKNETGWWFDDFKGHKIMKPPELVGKKMKLTARSFAAAVSFIFFPTNSGRFHNFSPLKSWNHSQFHFCCENNRKNAASFIQFHVKLPTKKEGFSIKPHLVSLKLPKFQFWNSILIKTLEITDTRNWNFWSWAVSKKTAPRAWTPGRYLYFQKFRLTLLSGEN